jgi:molybdopterin synthase sulfur carrier subunit
MPTTKLFANLRNVAGVKEVSVTGTSVQMVVSKLVAQYPLLETYLLENGQIRQHVIITINGHPTTDWDTPVTEQDQIAIFPPIAGG